MEDRSSQDRNNSKRGKVAPRTVGSGGLLNPHVSGEQHKRFTPRYIEVLGATLSRLASVARTTSAVDRRWAPVVSKHAFSAVDPPCRLRCRLTHFSSLS